MGCRENVDTPREPDRESVPAERRKPCGRTQSFATSKRVWVELVSLATTVLRQSLLCQARQQILRPGKRRIPLPLRLNLGEQPFAQSVLFTLAQLGGFIESHLQHLSHGQLILPPPLQLRSRKPPNGWRLSGESGDGGEADGVRCSDEMDSSFHVNGIKVPTWFGVIAALSERRSPWSILRRYESV